MKRLALATSKNFASLTEDDRLLIEPLRALGISAEATVWDDPGGDWKRYDAVILRSCWDYHLRLDEFLDWTRSLEAAGVPILNSPEMIRWNANKIYLRDLQARGVEIVPTIWPDAGTILAALMQGQGWSRAVVKPCVSATAHKTILVSAEDDAQIHFEELQASGVMVQQFMESVQTAGEWSLMFFSGEFSHAVIKTPKAGDFRVQHDFGGAERSAEPPTAILEAARKAIGVVEGLPLYARVDGVESDGRFLLMELELIEPALFLSLHKKAASRFAAAIADHVG